MSRIALEYKSRLKSLAGNSVPEMTYFQYMRSKSIIIAMQLASDTYILNYYV